MTVMTDEHTDIFNKQVFTQDGASLVDPRTGIRDEVATVATEMIARDARNR